MYFLQVILLCFQLFIIGLQGISFIPMPDPTNPGDTLIYYRAWDRGSILTWRYKIDASLLQYRDHRNEAAKKRVQCSWTSDVGEDEVCDVAVDDWHPCTSANQYNYPQAGPCIFLKLDEIVNWTPDPYNSTEDLPADMPPDLKQHIGVVSGRPYANMVWVSCGGEYPADEENIGPIQYIPQRGFPSYYFPFSNKEAYLSPLVAVLFEKPRTGILINIRCRAWAKNIYKDGYRPRGSVRFELMVDQPCH